MTPDLSIVIALKCARTEDPLEGIRAWTREQTCERGRLEVVVASNGDHPDWERRLPEVLTGFDRHIRPEPRLGTGGLLDAASRVARGRWIYVCELHTVPDPTCAEEVLAYLDANDVPGAVANSGTRGEGAMARVEARYYQEVVGPRLGGDDPPVAGRGFVIRRDVLAKAGGIQTAYSIFNDRVLEAHLRELGVKVGFAERAHFVHAEQSTRLGHRLDVSLYTWGEHACRSRNDDAFCDRHLGRPEEWAERHGYRRDIAWARAAALASAGWHALRKGRLRALRGIGREWLREAGRTVLGVHGEVAVAWLATGLSELRFRLARDDERRFATHVGTKRHWTRCVRLWLVGRDVRAGALQPLPTRTAWNVGELGDDELVGFHARECHPVAEGGIDFRWTLPSALVRLALEPGDYEVRIDTGGVRAGLAGLPLAIRWNRRTIPARNVTLEDDEIRFPIARDDFAGGGEQRLALACAPVPLAAAESREQRRLGLPIRSLSFEPRR